jgi:hypothetical protein
MPNNNENELKKHPILNDDSEDEAIGEYAKNQMTEDEYLDVLNHKYDLSSWGRTIAVKHSKHNTPEVNDHLNLQDVDGASQYMNISTNKLKEFHNADDAYNFGRYYNPDIHKDPDLVDRFATQYSKEGKNPDQFVQSIGGATPDQVKKYKNLLLLALSGGSRFYNDADKNVLQSIPEDELLSGSYKTMVSNRNLHLYRHLPESIQHKLNDKFLGIEGGNHGDEDVAQNPQENFENWDDGPTLDYKMSKIIAEKGNLTDAQAEHIARHGSKEQKFNMFMHNKGFNPAIKTMMYNKWSGDDHAHGYDVDDFKQANAEHQHSGDIDYDLMDKARDYAQDRYSMEDFFYDHDHNSWNDLLEEHGGDNDAARSAFIDKHFDGREEDAFDRYDEAINDDVRSKYDELMDEKHRDNALLNLDTLPEDMVNHESFAHIRSAIQDDQNSVEEAKRRKQEAEHEQFHNERIPQRELTHAYGPGQQQAELLKHEAEVRGGNVDIGTMHKLYPSLKETWKSIFGSKGKMSAEEAQAHIDSIPKTTWNISHTKWNAASIQNLNRQDQTVFRIDHNDQTLKALEDAGVTDTFNKINKLSMSSGHPTNSKTVGWARVDTTNPKHWIIDETQTDYSKAVRRFLKEHDKGKEGDDVDKIEQIHSLWHEALVNHVIKMAKKHGVERISTHTPESKSIHTGAESVHTVYKEAYGAMPNYGFQKVDADDVDALTNHGRQQLNTVEQAPTQSELNQTANLHAEAVAKHLHNAFHQHKILTEQGDNLSLLTKGKLHAGILASKEMAKKHKAAGLAINPDHSDLNNIEMTPAAHFGYGTDANPIENTADLDKMLLPKKVKKIKMQTMDLTGKSLLKKSNDFSYLLNAVYRYNECLDVLHKSVMDPLNLVMQQADEGNWVAAIKAANLIKRKPQYQNVFDMLAEKGVPSEHISEFLRHITGHRYQDTNTNALFGLAHNLHPNLTHQNLKEVANSLVPGSYLERSKIITHPNWNPFNEPNYPNQFAPHAFWHSYTKKVTPEHFSLVASVIGRDDYIGKKFHRGGIIEPVDHLMLAWNKDAHPEWIKQGGLEPYINWNHAQIKTSDIKDNLENHAIEHRNALLKDYYRGNPHDIQLKSFNGKQYIKLYRGVAGDIANHILSKMGHDEANNTLKNKSISVDAAPMSSWSVSKHMAERFAHGRGVDSNIQGKPIVIEQWHPLENIMHTDYHVTHPEFEHAHPDEQEVIVKHPDKKHKIKATDVHIGSTENPGMFQKPKIIKD